MNEYANKYAPDGALLANAGDLMMKDLANDPNGIAFCGYGHKTAGVKALALAAQEGAPYVELTKANVANRTYPLTRTVYIYINREPGKPVDPKIKEFFRYVLSNQGQADVTRQTIYLPLTAPMANEQLKKLD